MYRSLIYCDSEGTTTRAVPADHEAERTGPSWLVAAFGTAVPFACTSQHRTCGRGARGGVERHGGMAAWRHGGGVAAAGGRRRRGRGGMAAAARGEGGVQARGRRPQLAAGKAQAVRPRRRSCEAALAAEASGSSASATAQERLALVCAQWADAKDGHSGRGGGAGSCPWRVLPGCPMSRRRESWRSAPSRGRRCRRWRRSGPRRRCWGCGLCRRRTTFSGQ